MSDEARLAVVQSVETNGLALRFEGEETARSKPYKCLDSYIPTVGDRVYIVPVSGTFLIIGKVVDQPVTELHAASAGTAGSATRTTQVINQADTTQAYDIQLRTQSGGTVFQIRRGTAAWKTITVT